MNLLTDAINVVIAFVLSAKNVKHKNLIENLIVVLFAKMPKITKKANGVEKPDKNQRKIDRFFSKGQNSSDNSSINTHDLVSSYYISEVAKKSGHEKCEEQACACEKRKLQQQLASSMEKLAQTKEAVSTCERIIKKRTES